MNDRAAAWRVQADAAARGDLLIWTICENPSDYPGQFTARPHSGRKNVPLDFVLTAPTLDAIRELLPPGLTSLPLDPNDDPVIVETWI